MCQNLAKYEVTLHFFFNSQLSIFLESMKWGTIYSICMDGRTDRWTAITNLIHALR